RRRRSARAARSPRRAWTARGTRTWRASCRSCVANEMPQAARGHGQLGDAQAERRQRVAHGVGDDGGHGHRGGFAEALGAERRQRRRRDDVRDLDLLRRLGGRGHQIVHEGAGEELAVVVVLQLLVQGAAEAVQRAAVDLSSAIIGLMIVPASWTLTYLRILMAAVWRSTSTAITSAMKP